MAEGSPLLARPKDAPKIVGISRATLYAWAKAGHIRLRKMGGMTLFDPAEVKAYIDETAGG